MLLNMNYQEILQHIYQSVKPFQAEGHQADYIPLLAQVDPNQFGMSLHTIEGDVYSVEQAHTRFSIQSISKLFSLAMCLSLEKNDLWRRMGLEPSGSAFKSIVLLELEKGIPRNPFINAGAIVMTDILISHLKNPLEQYRDFVRQLCGDSTIDYNSELAASEQSNGYMNAAIANLLKYHGNIKNDIEQVLHTYFTLCSVEMSCDQLAQAFLPFANHQKPFDYAGIKLTSSNIKRINAIMQTCGFYDEAGEFSYRVGLPGKSSVGGGIAAVYPGQYSVAVWSPRLNVKGNSIMGMKALELLTTGTAQSIF